VEATFDPEFSRTQYYETDGLPRFAAAAHHAQALSKL